MSIDFKVIEVIKLQLNTAFVYHLLMWQVFSSLFMFHVTFTVNSHSVIPHQYPWHFYTLSRYSNA